MNSTWPAHINKSYPGGYTIKDEIVEPHGAKKLIYLQKVEFKDNGRTEYRFTYYVIGKGTDHWVFARNSVFVPTEILPILLEKAKEKNWPGF